MKTGANGNAIETPPLLFFVVFVDVDVDVNVDVAVDMDVDVCRRHRRC